MTNYAVRDVRKIADEPCPLDDMPEGGPERVLWDRLTRLAKVLAGDQQLAPSLFSDNLREPTGLDAGIRPPPPPPAPKSYLAPAPIPATTPTGAPVDQAVMERFTVILANMRRAKNRMQLRIFCEAPDENATDEYCLRVLAWAAMGIHDVRPSF